MLICSFEAAQAIHRPREAMETCHELTDGVNRATRCEMTDSRPDSNTIPRPPDRLLSPTDRPTDRLPHPPERALSPTDRPTERLPHPPERALSPTDRPTERLLNRISSHLVYDHLFSVASELGVTEAQFSQTKAASNNQPRYHIFKVSLVTLPDFCAIFLHRASHSKIQG